MLQAEHREDGESCARLTKVQQPPALAADGIRKFNRSYVLNAAASERRKPAAMAECSEQRSIGRVGGEACLRRTRSPAVTPEDRIRPGGLLLAAVLHSCASPLTQLSQLACQNDNFREF